MIRRVTFLYRAAIGCAMALSVATPAMAQSAPHAAHEAHFGGMFSPAAGDTLHVEAVWSEQRRLRVFISTASAEPLTIERLRDIRARVLIGNRASALELLEVDGYFEARIPTLALPATMVVALTTPAAPAEERLTMTFSTYSADVRGFGSSPPPEIPVTFRGILDALAEDRRAAQSFIDRGQFAFLSDPEERIRERAMAIEPHLDALDAGRRARWLLHMSLDYGDLPQRLAAFKAIADGLDRLDGLLREVAR